MNLNELFGEPQSNRCFVIAEAGLNHNGSIDIAMDLIDLAAKAGADAIKFQKRDVDTLAIKELLDAKDDRFPVFGSTYREIRAHLEFSLEEYRTLKAHAEKMNLIFMCTAFDIPSVNFLLFLGVKSFKLASHSLTNLPLLKYIAQHDLPVIQSTGMCTLEEIDDAMAIYKTGDITVILMHCVSSYPHSAEESTLLIMDELRERYKVKIGYSGHELGTIPTLAAAARGAAVIERHFTLDKSMEGFDHKISLDPDELINLTADIREIEKAISFAKKELKDIEHVTRNKYHVSAVSESSISKGSTLTQEKVVFRNPGTGIAPNELEKVLGLKATQDIPPDTILTIEMFEES